MNNCKAAYYVQCSYSYGNTAYTSLDISNNPCWEKLLNYVVIVFPDIEFNSAMVCLYEHGADDMRPHGNDEANMVQPQ